MCLEFPINIDTALITFNPNPTSKTSEKII